MIAPDPAPSGLEVWDKLLIAAMLVCSLPILAQLASKLVPLTLSLSKGWLGLPQ